MTIDPVAALLVAVSTGFAVAAGFALCSVTHRQRGLETDEVHVVPDFVPEGWVNAGR